ncbi:MAG: hypothetical protein M3Y24_04245 [Acidobacteriota bacterium]|nr:hypothetical protein [Acidobacteriota bacterium]
MSFQETFAPEEWSVIATVPHMIGTAVMMASFSGLGGTVKEAFSLATSLAEGRAGSNALLKELTAPEQISAAQTEFRAEIKALDPANLKPQLNAMAIDRSKQAIEILASKAPGEVGPYKQWLMDIAFGVANASKEGGFLGFGGKRISDAENEMLNSISEALGVPIPAAQV